MKRILLILLLLAALAPAPLTAQGYVPSDTAVFFLTVGPGREIYQQEGHTALAVHIPGQYDMVYNYGVFDFNQPNFVGRFVSGQTDYRAAAYPLAYFVEDVVAEHRRLEAHELALDPPARARLIEFLRENVKPHNAVYRYNYVKDNCATRPLRAIEIALADTIELGPAPFEQSGTPVTFRNMMRYYHRNYPWYQFGIDLALGSGIDYPLSRREEAFAPVELHSMLYDATSGGRRLVEGSYVMVDNPAYGGLGPTPWFLSPMAVACLVLALAGCFTVRDWRRHRVTRWFDALLFGAVGLCGLLLTYLIFVSVHEATSPNYLYFWINPAALLVPLLIWIKKAKNVLFYYQIVNFAVLIIFLFWWPFGPQSGNVAFLPLIAAELLRGGSYIGITRKSKD